MLDLWIQWWRHHHASGDVVMVRYCDDFVVGFEHEREARNYLMELQARFSRFGLKLNDDKTRLLEFGRYAIERRSRRGVGRPETFDFLGFTHYCGTTKNRGWFSVRRISAAARMRKTLSAIKQELRKRRHDSLGETGRWLGRVVQG